MATAEEILAEMAEEESADTGVLVIDPDTRVITIPERLRTAGVESDEDVRRYRFEMPLESDGINFSAFDVRINYRNAAGEEDIYIVTDAAAKGGMLTFSWLLSRKALRARGTLRFIVCMVLPDEAEADGIGREFNTTVAELTVLEGLEPKPVGEEEAADVTMQLLSLASMFTGKVDGGYVEDGALYLTAGETVVAGPFSGFGGGGGGGSGNNAVMTVKNTTGWLSRTIAQGASCPLSLSWSSLEGGLSTGSGTLSVRVGSALRQTRSVEQGDVTADVGPYLADGVNAVRVTIADVYGNTRTISFSVNVMTLALASTFDDTAAYSGEIEFRYTPTGMAEKTVFFELDGVLAGTQTVTTSGREQSFVLPAQAHGAHQLAVYMTAEADGETVFSNVLRYALLCVETDASTPIVACAYSAVLVTQYDTIEIPYIVYDPAGLTAEVAIRVGGETVMSLTGVDRTRQTCSLRLTQAGETCIEIACGESVWAHTLTVVSAQIAVQAESEGLALALLAQGRSNNESEPGVWTDSGVECAFENFNFRSDGWTIDEAGVTALRVAGDARLTIPLTPFAGDPRTTGMTIELEFATRDVRDYDAVLVSCMSGGRGLEVTAQAARLLSEQSAIGTQYREDTHLRLSFVIEKRSANRLLLCYIDGILSGAMQYPADDDFAQAAPVPICIGSSDCTIDLYGIRVYRTDLTRHQILGNWIADTADAALMAERYARNDVFDAYGQIVTAQLPAGLPYLILDGAVLPQYKGDKQTISGEYVDPAQPAKSFSFSGAEIDVQGTSSQFYTRKNYKIKFKGGFVLADGTSIGAYALREDSMPTDTFTFKADVASSEGANNVELVRLYEDACPYRTPPQREDARIRQGIDGLPIVGFWRDGDGRTSFLGRFNFNNDKGTEEVYGFTAGDESWETLNNTSGRVLFADDDFSGDAWQSDFEARYPDGSTDAERLAALAAWIRSTDRTQATGEALPAPVQIGGVGYDTDSAAYRLAKFRDEIGAHIALDSALFYYLFTEIYLMVDSRAKNSFPTRFAQDGVWCFLPYDMDTAIGTNNEGALAFGYALEDTDTLPSGADVYNGQRSVLFTNLRDAFPGEIKAMYQSLRSGGLISYGETERRFEEHQRVWPEAIFNEDSYFKYIEPLITEGSAIYLPMLQGSKAAQRGWWLYNRFRYMDSKYIAGDALSDYILLRGYAADDITVTPYADIYASVRYGSYTLQMRARRGEPCTLACPLENVNDTEIAIYSASQLSSVGDLSGLKVGQADFSMATRLQAVKVGDGAEDYSNGNLTSLHFGNNTLLRSADARNCPALAQAVDLSGCTNLETALFEGTAITGLNLPDGGILKVLHLPDTITNLTICNQALITDFTMPGFAAITTLRLENVSGAVDGYAILAAMPESSRVRLTGFAWEMASAEEILALYDRLDTMRGLDEGGGNVDKAQLAGTIRVNSLTGEQLAQMQSRYPFVSIVYAHITSTCRFFSEDGSELLCANTVQDGGDAVYSGGTPVKASTAQYAYSFAGWSRSPNASGADADALISVTADRDVYAVFTATIRTYTVRWYNGSTLLETDAGVPYGGSAAYNGSTPTYTGSGDAADYDFTGFSPNGTNITGDTSCYAQFKYNGYVYTKLIDRSLSGEYTNETVTSIGSYAFYSCSALTSVSLPVATSIGSNAFYSCSALTSVSLPAVTSIGDYAFYRCSALTSVSLPVATSIGGGAFNSCSKLEALILENADTVCKLNGTSVFSGTMIASGTGYIYVPSVLVDTYKAATNWSTYANQIRAIEDYPEITGGEDS